MPKFISWLRRENILQKFIPLIPTRKQPTRLQTTLFFIALGLIGFLILGFHPDKVNAEEFAYNLRRYDWRGASFPVENFQRYSSPYGYRWHPDGASGWGFHRGLDLAAPAGSYIRSWSTGQVIKVANDRLCGTQITIRSGEWEHIYCHLKGRAKASSQGRYLSDENGGIQIWEGQQVSAGTRIGRVGTTGRTTGPHLHWGLKYTGSYVDPALVLEAMYEQQQSRR